MSRVNLLSHVMQATGILALAAVIASNPPAKAIDSVAPSRPTRHQWTPVKWTPDKSNPAQLVAVPTAPRTGANL